MSDDRLHLDLAMLEEPVPIRPEFVSSLRERLHAELGFAPMAVATAPAPAVPQRAGVPAPGPAGRPLDGLRHALRSLWPATPRVAVLALLVLILMAGTVAAGILILRGWISTTPRGLQHTDDFAYAEVYREPGAQYDDLVLAPDGRGAYAVRFPQWTGGGTANPGGIVRFEVVDAAWSAPTELIRFDQLLDPSLWEPGVDLSTTTVSQTGALVFGDGLSVAPDGSLVVGVTAFAGWDTESQQSVATSLVAIRPDGSAQKIVTGGELLAEGLVTDDAGTTSGITGVASGSDWIWARAEIHAPDGEEFRLLEIVDPTRDGDWSDRIVRPLVLPAEVPRVEAGAFGTAYGPFVAEPSVDGRDRSRSVLLPILERTGDIAIYRVADPDGDGDATDPGETVLVYSGQRPSGRLYPVRLVMTPRVVVDGSDIVVDELLVAGLTRDTRVSRITPAGVVDIMRALPFTPSGLAATRDGRIFVPLQAADDSASPDPETGWAPSAFVLGRLAPVPAGEQPAGVASSPTTPASPAPSPPAASPTSPAASPTPAPSGPAASPTPRRSVPPDGPILPLGAITPGVARLSVGLFAGELDQEVLLGADGSGAALVVPGSRRVLNVCQSADTSRIAFQADDEVPGEFWTYVSEPDGASRVKVTEEDRFLVCPFPTEAILLEPHGDPLHRLYRHDLASGEEREVARGIVLAASPDGQAVAIATGDGDRTLVLLDAVTGSVRTLAGPFEQRVFAAWWSPSGDRLAYGVGPFADCCDMGVSAAFDIRLVGLDGRGDRSVLAGNGRFPGVSWSADDARLLVRTPVQGATSSEILGDVQLVDVTTGASRPAGNGDVVFAAWSPVDADVYAYATPQALYLATVAGSARKVADAPSDTLLSPKGGWPRGGWGGWSPDGAYIGLPLGGGRFRVAVVELASGTARLLIVEDDVVGMWGWKWWR